MAKASQRHRADIKEVTVEKVDSRISLESILDQLGKKGVPQAGSRSRSIRERSARIKQLSQELAREIRALKEESAAAKPVKKAPKQR
jgi:hypothetical protein